MNYEDMTTDQVAAMLGIKTFELYHFRLVLPLSVRKSKRIGRGNAAVYDDETIHLLKFAIALRQEKNLKWDEIKKRVAVRHGNMRQGSVAIERNESCVSCGKKISILKYSTSQRCEKHCGKKKKNSSSRINALPAKPVQMNEKQELKNTRNLADQINSLNEVIERQEREKKDLRDRIATLENSLDNLLATISDLRNHQQPQPVQQVTPEPEPEQVAINDSGKKWWAIKPLQKLLNGGM